jgi:glycogen synthase
LKIIIYSSTFWPAVGGIEKIMMGLAEEWQIMGHSLQVFTRTKQSTDKVSFGFPILDNYSTKQLLRAVSNADIYVEANISLKNILIGLLNRKKWWVIHHVYYTHERKISGYLKLLFSLLPKNIVVSEFMARKILGNSTIIPNFYSPIFNILPNHQKLVDFVFVGRLVSDKGVDRLLKALKIFEKNFSCILIGDGPEKKELEGFVTKENLNDKIRFEGYLTGDLLVKALSGSKVMVIPSIWDEPFGVVALEGMASCCLIACSNKQGLKEATGGLAFQFDPESPESICVALHKALVFKPNQEYKEAVEAHLKKHERGIIAQKYITLFENSSL